MRISTLIAAMLLTLGLAACTPPPPATAQANAVKPATNPNCRIVAQNVRLRPGDNWPVGYTVRNTGQWCFNAFRFDGSAPGADLVDNPAHGEVRVIQRGDATMVGYRPRPGYVGGDSFLISVPTGLGYSTNLAVTVRVSP